MHFFVFYNFSSIFRQINGEFHQSHIESTNSSPLLCSQAKQQDKVGGSGMLK